MKYLTDFRKTVETGADPRLITVIFNFPGVDQPLYMLWNGYCLLSLNPLYCDIYSSLTPRG